MPVLPQPDTALAGHLLGPSPPFPRQPACLARQDARCPLFSAPHLVFCFAWCRAGYSSVIQEKAMTHEATVLSRAKYFIRFAGTLPCVMK